jgi:hypothetical protein
MNGPGSSDPVADHIGDNCPAPLQLEQKGFRVDPRARRQKNRWKLLRMNKGRNSMTNCDSHSKLTVFFDLKGAVP